MKDEIARLIEPQIPALRRYARGLLRDREAADDLVQDTLERAVARWSLRRRDGDLKAWLFTIQRNLFLDRLRQGKRRSIHIGGDVTDTLPSPGPQPDGALGVQDVLVGLADLPEEQRSALLLVAIEDFSYEAASKLLNVPVGTIMSRLSRARHRMRSFAETGRIVALRRVK